MLKTSKKNASRLYLAVLEILEPEAEPTTSEDVKKHVIAELFLGGKNDLEEWSTGRLMALAEWIEGHVAEQMCEQDADVLLIDYDSVLDFQEVVGAFTAIKAMPLAGLLKSDGDWYYGDLSARKKADRQG